MQIFKTRWFHKWAISVKLDDKALLSAVEEIVNGLIDANLGGHVFKKRLGLHGLGKRGGIRTLVAFKTTDRIFFIYGFPKNQRANIKIDELKALKLYARELLGYSDRALSKAIEVKILFEVINDES